MGDQVRFEILTAASMKMVGFWVFAQCRLVEDYRRYICFNNQ